MSHATTPNLGVQDFFTTTLSGNVAATDTIINLTNVPTPSEGFLVIDPNNPTTREIIYYNSKTSTTVTCPDAISGSGRGVGGTTVQAHLSNVAVELRDVAEYWLALQNGQSLGAGSIPASTLASGVLSPANFANPYKFSVYLAGTVTNGGTAALVTFDTKSYDTGTNYSTSTGKFVAPVSGFYHFSANIGVPTASGTGYAIWLYKNGSVIKNGGSSIAANTNSFATNNSVNGDLQLAANDYIQVYFQGQNGAAYVTGPAATFFDGYLVSAT